MKKRFLILILFAIISSSVSAQSHEIGVFLGGSNYIGDIGRDALILPNNIAVGGIYKLDLSSRYALRAQYTYAKISGDDTESKNSYRRYRGIAFSNSVHEFAAGIEFNFFNYDLSALGSANTPYIIIEAGVSNYDTREDGRTFNFTIPVGLGFKGRLAYNIAYAIETSFRYTFKDDIDGYYNGTQYISGEDSSGNYIYKTIEDSNSNDWYVFTGITITYVFDVDARSWKHLWERF
jgi:hypothetical protein